MTISYLKIANYRSIDVLQLHDIKPFSVFAGPNGSGKSNFFEALDFINLVIRFGADEALKKQGGFENIRCWKRHELDARVFEFEISIDGLNSYQLKIHQLDKSPMLEERLQQINDDGSMWTIHREAGKALKQGDKTIDLPFNLSMLLFFGTSSISQFLKNIRRYQFDSLEARIAVKNQDISELNHNGRNLAGVLRRLEKDEEIYDIISEWMDLLVPGLEKVYTDLDRLDGNTQLAFKEEYIDKPFPAYLIYDGTIKLLNVLVAMFDRSAPFGMLLIEEPESGLHPKAVIELVEDFREEATLERPIWVTTHHDSLIRCLKNNELWLVDKKQGATQMKVDTMLYETMQGWYQTAEERGEKRGEAEMLLHVLTDKFGKVDKQTEAIISSLDEKSLFECVGRLSSAHSVQDVISHKRSSL
ncbi:MAG: AAA family ATPase [Pseudomonadota bacterium]